MSKVIIAGGSLAGLAAALAMAGCGHRVLVLERGAPPPAGPAGQQWIRPTIDATGRRAEARSWLADAGLPLPADQTSPSGLRGFTRFYRRSGPPGVLNRGNAAGVISDHYAGVLHPGDGGTFTIALCVLPRDRAMRSLRPASPTRCTGAACRWPWSTPSASPTCTWRTRSRAGPDRGGGSAGL